MPRLLVAVVDDERPVRRALGRLLTHSGFEVVEFADARAYLQAQGALAPHCLLLDVHMPDMGGFEVLSRLECEARRIAAVLITASDDPAVLADCERSGLPWLRKPAPRALLLERLRSAYGGLSGVDPGGVAS